jgi:hypothetical protein
MVRHDGPLEVVGLVLAIDSSIRRSFSSAFPRWRWPNHYTVCARSNARYTTIALKTDGMMDMSKPPLGTGKPNSPGLRLPVKS